MGKINKLKPEQQEMARDILALWRQVFDGYYLKKGPYAEIKQPVDMWFSNPMFEVRCAYLIVSGNYIYKDEYPRLYAFLKPKLYKMRRDYLPRYLEGIRVKNQETEVK